MLVPEKLRDLSLHSPPQPGRWPHLAAASGLVRAGRHLYVIADDEHHLGVFDVPPSQAPGTLLRLVDGELPDDKRARKKLKPDFEALLRLPPRPAAPHGALLALGSGSKPQRRSGTLLMLDAQGAACGAPRPVDLAPLYGTLAAELGELNIEGALIAGGQLLLLQRGNKGVGRNAVITLGLADALQALLHSGSTAGLHPLAIADHALGSVDGVPLCFSDGAALPDGSWLYLAIAENTADSYADGPCAGAELGLIGADGVRRWSRPLEGRLKPEGIEVMERAGRLDLLLVTDADDAAVPAALYALRIAR